MNSIIITGASGLLGQFLCKYFSNQYKVIGIYNTTIPDLSNVNLIKLDLADAKNLESIIQKHQPQFIIHTAGYTSVDDCEMNPEFAHLQNVICTKNICRASAGLDVKLLLISTDHLFKGSESYYSEDSKVEPLNIYAQTKFLAEVESLKFNNTIIVRTNFYGGHTNKKLSFSSWIYNELKLGKKINMFDDVFFTPISICTLAENIESILKSNLVGIYNIVGNERLSKYDFAVKLAKVFNIPLELISKSSLQNTSLKAKRPKDMSLSIVKIVKELPSFKVENINEGLERIKVLGLM